MTLHWKIQCIFLNKKYRVFSISKSKTFYFAFPNKVSIDTTSIDTALLFSFFPSNNPIQFNFSQICWKYFYFFAEWRKSIWKPFHRFWQVTDIYQKKNSVMVHKGFAFSFPRSDIKWILLANAWFCPKSTKTNQSSLNSYVKYIP